MCFTSFQKLFRPNFCFFLGHNIFSPEKMGEEDIELNDQSTRNAGQMMISLFGFAAPKMISPEPAGIYYEVHRVRDRLLFGEDCSDVLGPSYVKYYGEKNGFSSSSADNSDVENLDTDNWLDAENDAYFRYLKSLDPTAWKEQDHYKVLGLGRLRYKATDSQIKIAYRKKVLHHHPDKRRHKGFVVKLGDEDYFTCISKAYEILSNNQKRRAYDSVDPLFDDAIPTSATKENFFKLFAPVFERNERWSSKRSGPKLGDENAPFAEVDRFYKFWYDFDSWREFSYLDEEDKEKGENRDERRWIEKQNRVQREKRRKDEMKRIRTLVDNAYKCDPRIQKYQEEEKRRKEQLKLAKEEIRRAKQEEEDRLKREAAEAERRRREEEEEIRKQQQLAEKREKEALKKCLQKERKALKEYCQNANYFAENDDETLRFRNMTDADRMCQTLSLDRMKELNEQLRDGSKPAAVVFRRFADELNESLRHENEKLRDIALGLGAGENEGAECADACRWTAEETQLLVKAVTLFPVGTKSRWDVIAAFINEHRKAEEGTNAKNGKDVVAKVKEMQKLDEKSKDNAAKGLPLLQTKSNMQVETPPSIRTESPAELVSDGNPWTAEEQKLLEQALRTYPADDPDRWEKIKSCLPGRTKKECVKRYKEIAELVRARKVALQQQQSSTAKATKISSK